jgi:hypothetical protein
VCDTDMGNPTVELSILLPASTPLLSYFIVLLAYGDAAFPEEMVELRQRHEHCVTTEYP